VCSKDLPVADKGTESPLSLIVLTRMFIWSTTGAFSSFSSFPIIQSALNGLKHIIKPNLSNISMDPADLRDILLGIGPGPRGDGCDICMEVMKVGDHTVTHISCENTFHGACLREWIDSNKRQNRSTTCPKCRAPLSKPEPFSDPNPLLPTELRNFGMQPASTTQSQMYEYDTNEENFPTPALIRFFCAHRQAAIDWLEDYFVRLRRAQGLSYEEACAHFLDYLSLLDRAEIPENAGILEDGIGERGCVTDLETIGGMGQRHPRPSVVNFFEEDLDRAKEWLQHRMNRIQRELALDYHQMQHIRRSFIRDVDEEIQTREHRRANVNHNDAAMY